MPARRRLPSLGAAPFAVACALAAFAGCGGDGDLPRVAAAASLRDALGTLDGARLSFAGSDLLAGQIRAGARPDVYVAADERLPRALHRSGLVERPVAVAVNELVVAVRAGERRVRTLDDLARRGLRLALGAPTVPVGAYARRALAGLDATTRGRIFAAVRSQEPDATGIVGKLRGGAVDAGLVYRSDVRAARGRLRAIALPARLRPRIVYAAAVVRGAAHAGAGRRWLALLRGPRGARALRAAGLEPVR